MIKISIKLQIWKSMFYKSIELVEFFRYFELIDKTKFIQERECIIRLMDITAV